MRIYKLTAVFLALATPAGAVNRGELNRHTMAAILEAVGSTTTVDASRITGGPVSSSILPSTVAYTSSANAFTQTQTISYGLSLATMTASGLVFANTLGVGSGRTISNSGSASLQFTNLGNYGYDFGDVTTNFSDLSLRSSGATIPYGLAGGSVTLSAASPVKLSTWTATYVGGSAFMCVDNLGVLFVSEAACP